MKQFLALVGIFVLLGGMIGISNKESYDDGVKIMEIKAYHHNAAGWYRLPDGTIMFLWNDEIQNITNQIVKIVIH